MAHGYPDWAVPINISGQELSEIMSRPKYGAAERIYIALAGDTAPYNILANISGTGVVYPSMIGVSGHSDGKLCRLEIIVDGAVIFYDTYQWLEGWQVNSLFSDFVWLQNYDASREIYTMCISHGITFESSLFIKLHNYNQVELTIEAHIGYALI